MTYPRKTGKALPPHYAGIPVIISHIGTDDDPTRTVCTGERFHSPRAGTYPLVPVTPCPLCTVFSLAEGYRKAASR